ncbi:hypothetical protein GCM10010104_39090 [Streptomyces indiaensis]|uniref:Uncharacterized protein n=1 Tax=Streptomyces indiaensis TaxID=284033 RepID=A0ABP5QQC5_9ACTN
MLLATPRTPRTQFSVPWSAASSAERRCDSEGKEILVPQANKWRPSRANDKPPLAWNRGLLFALSLLFGYIGSPWQGALVLGGIGAVVGVVQPPLNRAVRRAMYGDE